MTSETLTKLILNNKIVEMRKNVRQARIHCISKLCREIRKLKEKKGTEEQMAKNLRKVNRLTEQMAVMKKINADTVSKFALQNEKTMIEIVNDVNESIENKALSRLACHKSVHEQVLKFRKTCPEWKKSLENLLESLGEKYRNKKPKKPVRSSKGDKKSSVKRKGVDSPAHSERKKMSSPSQANLINSSSGSWTIENFDQNSDPSNNLLEDMSDSLQSTEKKYCCDKTEKSNNNPKKKSFKNKSENIGICDNDVVQTKSDLPQISEKNFICNKPFATEIKKNVKAETSLEKILVADIPDIAVDPFFITKDNREYLSISAKKCSVDEESRDGLEKVKYKTSSSKPDRIHSNHKPYGPKSFSKNGAYPKPNFNKSKSFNYTQPKVNHLKDVAAPVSLHPSWEAKKKLSTVIQNSQFQGKKIKFDD